MVSGAIRFLTSWLGHDCSKGYILISSRKREYVLAGLALAAILALTYGEVVFFGYTLSPATYSPGVTDGGPWNYTGRRIAQYPMLDAWAASLPDLPMDQIVLQYIRNFDLPLWNPYAGAGTPLAADSTTSVYTPIKIIEYLPVPYSYDLYILSRIWIAGLLTYLFLRKLNLCQAASLSGAVFYMLSGAFTWYPDPVWVNVSMYAPLLLYGVESIAESPTFSNSIVVTAATFLSILGAHIETIVLQFILATLYLTYRLSTQRLLVWKKLIAYFVSIVAGIGTSAFYVFPVFEYLSQSALAHTGTGAWALPASLAITAFVPYIIGGPGAYWSPTFNQSGVVTLLGGYVGVACLFLAIVGLISGLRSPLVRRRIAIFFFVVAVVALLKSYGMPVINLIGTLPVLDNIVFFKFSGFIWAIGFAGAAAVGVDAIISERPLGAVKASAIITSVAVGTLTLLLLPLLRSEGNTLAINWVALNLLLAASIMVGFVIASIRVSQTRATNWIIVELVVLVSAFYVPRGLPYQYQFIQSAIMLGGLTAIVLLLLLPHRLQTPKANNLRHIVLTVIVLVILIAQVGLSSASPSGLPNRYDPFTPAPYVDYLLKHAGYYRVYSVGQMTNELSPNFAGVFGLYDLGIMSSFNVKSFYEFKISNLDSGATATSLGQAELRPVARTTQVDELRKNLASYSFLGVKYIITRSDSSADMGQIRSFKLVYSKEAFIYENLEVCARTFVVNNYRVEPPKQALDPTEVVTLQACPLAIRTFELAQSNEMYSSTASILSYTPNRIVIGANVTNSGILVLTDTYYPGWVAEVDGRQVNLFLVNSLVRGVSVQPGQHVIVFTYEPLSFFVGSILSLLSVTLLVGCGLYFRRPLKAHDYGNRCGTQPSLNRAITFFF